MNESVIINEDTESLIILSAQDPDSYEITYDSTKFIDMVKSACGMNEGHAGKFNILNHPR